MFSVNREDSAGGIVLIEIALALPIFFAILFLILGYAYWKHSQDALSSSIVKGIQAGVTRGNADLMNAINLYEDGAADDRLGLISKIEEFRTSGDWDAVSVLFRSGDITPGEAQGVYNDWMLAAFGPGGMHNIQNIPTEALYSLFYTLEFMRVTFGGMVRFPCDPVTGAPGTDPDRCLRCEFMGYQELGCANADGSKNTDECEFLPGCGNIPRNRFGIKCSYRPYMTFANMMGLVGAHGDVIVRSSFDYEIERREFG